MTRLENENPSKAEEKLFLYAGFYKVEDDEQHTRYVPVHMDKPDSFSRTLEVDDTQLDWTTGITFYHMAQTVRCIGMFDATIIDLIQDRIVELEWEF